MLFTQPRDLQHRNKEIKFLVSDSQHTRHMRIREFLTSDSTIIAVLLAAVDLEWTIRRVIDQISYAVTEAIISDRISGLDGYAKEWNKVNKGVGKQRLQDIVDNWDSLKDAFQLRHDIIHGRQGTSGAIYVRKRVELMLAASEAIADYGRKLGADPYRKLRGKAKLSKPTPKKP